jgi:hypothetical protein
MHCLQLPASSRLTHRPDSQTSASPRSESAACATLTPHSLLLTLCLRLPWLNLCSRLLDDSELESVQRLSGHTLLPCPERLGAFLAGAAPWTAGGGNRSDPPIAVFETLQLR